MAWAAEVGGHATRWHTVYLGRVPDEKGARGAMREAPGINPFRNDPSREKAERMAASR